MSDILHSLVKFYLFSFEYLDGEEKEKRPVNVPYVDVRLCYSPEVSSERRCRSKGSGSVYDPVFGICCHFCRQKKLCGEEDCKWCNDLDVDQPCLGKTDCSVCHSTNGVLCRACLKVRYGEEMEEVRENKQWKCPRCIEEEATRPYWICNSSLCLKKRRWSQLVIWALGELVIDGEEEDRADSDEERQWKKKRKKQIGEELRS
ncbi:putative Zinc-finger domain of monoamine-oxidase A repressor R1 [Helianthus anomalus]